MTPKYTIEVYEHGALLIAPPGTSGVPIDAIADANKLMPATAVVECGIAHYYNVSDAARKIVMAIAKSSAAGKRWREQVTKALQTLPANCRWWRGLDVGLSSAALFGAVMESAPDRLPAKRYGAGRTPLDADDFGRCIRMLRAHPGSRNSLDRAAIAYPTTAWPRIVARWKEIEGATPDQQTVILGEIHRAHRDSMAPSPPTQVGEANEV